ncbi:GmrSD restriction endonuclease domain-containing protein [Gordonia aquimaris]|uniref:DUF1524 domain-containing protein n=1 Tax=Gordonia aquimaris TaxID=2984863 RepID=A0A9X3D915_9ACTN|nr:DUF1524 domain-containing protein [Gordonia aquimaris]MCX2965926.1 DUF1524 domain-containing protein [Gordonia aquimaris]
MPKTTPIRRRTWLLLGVLLVAALGLVVVSALPDADDTTAGGDRTAVGSTVPSAPASGSAARSVSPAPETTAPPAGQSEAVRRSLTTLDTLAVKGRAPRTGYEREQFGQSWSDDVSVTDGHNGCDTRNDILRRDLTDVALKPDTRGCVVLAGTLDDPYTRQTISFTRGPDTSAQIQIDHVVALSDAWQKGAQQLDADRRRDFANDPRNLQAVAGSANQRKSDGDAATWLPPNKSYRCTYVSRQIEVKSLYRLWVTPAEKDAMTRVLTACSGTAIPTSETASPPPTKTDRVAPASYFPNCAAARAAGATPLRLGQPGYRAALDGDGDGVACE